MAHNQIRIPRYPLWYEVKREVLNTTDDDFKQYCEENGLDYQDVDLNLHQTAVAITFFKG